MSFESTVLGLVFNVDNWAKKPLIDLRGKFPAVKDEYDITFCEENPVVCKADLHYPASADGKLPVLLNIHGGGWIIGDKSNSTSYCLQIADSGFFVMNINYGMPAKILPPLFNKVDPKENHRADWLWPYPIQTHFKAMKWLEENADKYNLDLSKVFVSGDSAGSHMTGVVCACFCDDDYAKALGVEKPSFEPKGYVMNCGIYKVSFYEHIPIGRAMMQSFTGYKKIKECPLYAQLNPLPYINKKANNVLVCKGQADIMTIFQSDWMKKRLDEVGANADIYVGRGFPLFAFHDFMFLTFTKQSKACMKYTADWLKATAEK
ncbi:MAG: alpha/beta hydrolase fold domain-containing protein [Clostridia bacterium]|nr:alpha/beta hydrolase fold domain-containing protein [Clostridia bacterium]MBR6479613.1 alpha/beta hydrolase fold domain-containing protein [Clostridia bacterium]MBR6512299.1 alpha/beta hydrolase fold domain-containing protein [Clostridia bacterium]